LNEISSEFGGSLRAVLFAYIGLDLVHTKSVTVMQNQILRFQNNIIVLLWCKYAEFIHIYIFICMYIIFQFNCYKKKIIERNNNHDSAKNK